MLMMKISIPFLIPPLYFACSYRSSLPADSEVHSLKSNALTHNKSIIQFYFKVYSTVTGPRLPDMACEKLNQAQVRGDTT